jgi:hypothetical protein
LASVVHTTVVPSRTVTDAVASAPAPLIVGSGSTVLFCAGDAIVGGAATVSTTIDSVPLSPLVPAPLTARVDNTCVPSGSAEAAVAA